MPLKFKKVMIANRGEIAVRVIRSCREMGIRTVAVYSDADETAPHVMMADEAYHIGGSQAKDSYLRMDVIIETALKASVDAIHPGYGFLSENADFVDAVTAAGMVFIGPPGSAMRSMGSKTQARRVMIDADVPVVPGDKTGLESDEEAYASARNIGYPVLIKAAMGGGGKGMRVVRAEEDLIDSMNAAKREALSGFGDDEVYLEKFIDAYLNSYPKPPIVCSQRDVLRSAFDQLRTFKQWNVAIATSGKGTPYTHALTGNTYQTVVRTPDNNKIKQVHSGFETATRIDLKANELRMKPLLLVYLADPMVKYSDGTFCFPGASEPLVLLGIVSPVAKGKRDEFMRGNRDH
ncbi:MAG: ATP-grasp domain-containing protein, partial [Calditrichaeota bacterium]|nr:ATP-grasp domain-containing protein [Calditrichota bacterium]